MTTPITDYFTEHVPKDWFASEPQVEWDDDEILVLGALPEGVSAEDFREATRADRMTIAGDAESLFRRRVSWGVVRNGAPTYFTTLGVPAMTRLRFKERAVLDTLIESGVARSRSEALSWCVKLVARHEADWLAELRDALEGVEKVRREGPVQV
jgi:hypothetical protein